MIEFPEMRSQLVEALRSLSDTDHQHRIWIQHLYPSPNYFEDFALVVNILLDDLGFIGGARSRIGTVLRDIDEARLVDRVTAALRQVLTRMPERAADDVALADPSWSEVVATASAALAALKNDSASG